MASLIHWVRSLYTTREAFPVLGIYMLTITYLVIMYSATRMPTAGDYRGSWLRPHLVRIDILEPIEHRASSTFPGIRNLLCTFSYSRFYMGHGASYLYARPIARGLGYFVPPAIRQVFLMRAMFVEGH